MAAVALCAVARRGRIGAQARDRTILRRGYQRAAGGVAGFWYVVPEMRRKGIGRTLVEAAATWGRAQGCIEFGSDTEPDNEISRVAHHALGFQDVGLVRCFRKAL